MSGLKELVLFTNPSGGRAGLALGYSVADWSDRLKQKGLSPSDKEEWSKFTISDLFSGKNTAQTLPVKSASHYQRIQSPSDDGFDQARQRLDCFGKLKGSVLGEWAAYCADELNYFDFQPDETAESADVSFDADRLQQQGCVGCSRLVMHVGTRKLKNINFHLPVISGASAAHIAVDIVAGKETDFEIGEFHPPSNDGRISVSFRIFLDEKSSVTYRSIFSGNVVSKTGVYTHLEADSEFTSVSAGVLDASARRHLTVKADHAGERSKSRQIHKAIVAGSSVCEFDSQVYVQHTAKQADSHQLSKHILLSDDARVYANPRLKIETDEVVCGHGATVGSLDADALNYFASRGIPRSDAKKTLIQAFLSEAAHYGNGRASDRVKERLSSALTEIFTKEQG